MHAVYMFIGFVQNYSPKPTDFGREIDPIISRRIGIRSSGPSIAIVGESDGMELVGAEDSQGVGVSVWPDDGKYDGLPVGS